MARATLRLAAVLTAAAVAQAVLCGPVLAADPAIPGGLIPGPRATVAGVVDGDTLRLSDGKEVRLVGLQAPKLPLGRRNFPTWPLAEEARAAVMAAVPPGSVVRLHWPTTRGDRHGRLLAHVETAGGAWLQGLMLRDGWARVYTFADNRDGAAAMLGLEAEARAARRGIWNHPFYAVRDAASVPTPYEGYALVEGRVLAVGEARGRTYLNFGRDRRTDFTAVLNRQAVRALRDVGGDPKALEGRRLRIRGWLEPVNGPSIAVTHPEQVEVLER